MTLCGTRGGGHRGASWSTLAVVVVTAATAALVASLASAEVFECTGPHGHVTYSDAPCPGESSVRLDLKEPVEDLNPRRPSVAPVTVPRPSAVAAAAAPAAERRNGSYELSYGDRQRIANLEQVERNPSAYPEQRQAATLEIFNIRRGAVARMSSDDLRKKNDYWTDLESIEANRRQVGASQLANLFASYP